LRDETPLSGGVDGKLKPFNRECEMIVYVLFVNGEYQVIIDRRDVSEICATFRMWNEADDYASFNYREIYVGRM